MLLKVENLSVSYYMDYGKIEAVKNVTFDLEKGEILSIIGESGSGKSTLAKAILRAIRPPGKIEDGSKVFFNDIDILSMKESNFRREILWKHISYVPQSSQNSLNNTMKIIDHFYDTAFSHGLNDKEEIRNTSKELLKMVRLDPDRVSNAYPFQLSGGMKQRVLIALSLLLNPDLIIMDEAVSSLDVATQRYILEIIKDINRKTGVSIIFITHDISIAAFISTKVIVMYAGEIMEVGRTEDVVKNPFHPYTVGLINSVPSINSNVSQIKPIKEGYPSAKGCPFNTRCEKVMGICMTSEPPMYSVSNRYVRCFLYGNNKA